MNESDDDDLVKDDVDAPGVKEEEGLKQEQPPKPVVPNVNWMPPNHIMPQN